MGPIVDTRDTERILRNMTITAQQKIRLLQDLERTSTTADIYKQQRQVQQNMGKAAAWLAGVGLSPVYAPWAAHLAVWTAESAWDTAQWSAGRY
jgi:hypothetical protein